MTRVTASDTVEFSNRAEAEKQLAEILQKFPTWTGQIEVVQRDSGWYTIADAELTAAGEMLTLKDWWLGGYPVFDY